MTFRVLDPTPRRKHRRSASPRRAWPRSKARPSASSPTARKAPRAIFAHLDRMLREELGVAEVVMPHRSRTTARRPTPISSTRSRTGMPSSPASAIEAAAHRAVCTTPSRLNGYGVPAIGVMTARFVSAAEMMCRVLGMPDYKLRDDRPSDQQRVGRAACGVCACDRRAGAPPAASDIGLCALVGPADIIVGQDAKRGAIEIVVLIAFERPQEGDQPGESKHKRERNEVEQDIHDTSSTAVGAIGPRVFASGSTVGTDIAGAGVSLNCSPRIGSRARNAFRVTRIEEPDMARAAIRGVTRPAIAIGTAKAL